MTLIAEVNVSRRLGVEHEFCLPLLGRGSGRDVQNCLAEILTANGIRAIARDYDHSPIPDGVDVCVEKDASVRGETRFQGISWFPIEIKTRILASLADWESLVPRVLQIASYMGGRINPSCGFHAHIEFTEAREDYSRVRSLINIIHRFEPLLYALQPPSRRSNSFCHPLPENIVRDIQRCRTQRCMERHMPAWDRYTALNLCHLRGDSPRVEARWGAGTLDPDKSRHWLRLLMRLVDHAVARNCQSAREQVAPSLDSLKNFYWTIGLAQNTGIYAKVDPQLRDTARYLRKRFKKLNPDLCGISRTISSAPEVEED